MWNWTETEIELVLMRHGSTKSNEEHRYLGKADESLSQNGREQLQQAKQAGRYPDVDFLYVSPMKRCLETADLLYPGQKREIIPVWSEMDFGAFEGKNYQELSGDARYQVWIDSNGTLPFPEGESREDFVKRNAKGFAFMMRDVEQQLSEKAEGHIRIGAVVHGGTIMSVLSTFGDGDYFDYQIKNGDGWRGSVSGTDEGVRITDLKKLTEN